MRGVLVSRVYIRMVNQNQSKSLPPLPLLHTFLLCFHYLRFLISKSNQVDSQENRESKREASESVNDRNQAFLEFKARCCCSQVQALELGKSEFNGKKEGRSSAVAATLFPLFG